MKVFLCYDGFCEPFNISPNQTVVALKQMVKDGFLVQLSNDQQVQQYLELSYGGAALQDSWALCDIGITNGSTIKCLVKSEQRPALSVFNTVTGETLPIIGLESSLHTSVAKLKTMVSVQSGIPVSAFWLCTPSGVQLYDCNWLDEHGLVRGTTLLLDTWDGWVEFLQGCLWGHRLTVQSCLSEEKSVKKFQLRMALYIAASLGYLNLADWLLEMGVHAGEPIGVHPYRLWCQPTAHQDTGKCPIHAAAESSQLIVLKLFITKNLLSLACLDPGGRDPLKIAIQHGHRDCARYLANKLGSVVFFPNMCLPMRIYLQIKRWVQLGKKKTTSSRRHYTGEATLGYTLLIDGFNHLNMSSKSRKAENKSETEIKIKALQALPTISSHLLSNRATSLLPSLQPVKDMQKKQKPCTKSRENDLFDKRKEINKSLCRRRLILPPVTRENIPRPVFVDASPKSVHSLNRSVESSHHWGQTPREHAVYCLTIASTFTEKPWLKQLNIARTLVKKHFHSMA